MNCQEAESYYGDAMDVLSHLILVARADARKASTIDAHALERVWDYIRDQWHEAERAAQIGVARDIRIVSGSGVPSRTRIYDAFATGAYVRYTGKRTVRALKLRLARERRNGNDWARALVYSHPRPCGPAYQDFDTRDYI